MKKRSFLKIATEIEERVSAAATREGEKIKYFLRKEDEALKCKKTEQDFPYDKKEMVTNESVPESSNKIVGNINERDSGETTETKLQIINGASVNYQIYLQFFDLCIYFLQKFS